MVWGVVSGGGGGGGRCVLEDKLSEHASMKYVCVLVVVCAAVDDVSA